MATFNYQLSENEIHLISKQINKSIQEQLSSSSAFKELSEKTNNVAKIFADQFLSQKAINFEIKEILKPLVIEEMKNYINSVPELWQKTIEDYFKSDNFKRRELYELRKRIEELESELE